MAIESVSLANLAPPQPQQRTDQASQTAQAEQSRQTAEARRPEPTPADNEASANQPPQPVVNAQGQMTGRVINAIA